MSGGWRDSDRRERLPPDWPARRAAVLKRDLYRCQWVVEDGLCRAVATDVDHVIRGDDHSYGNLQSLCADHHKQKTAREGVEARAERKKKAYLPPDGAWY